MNDNSARHNRFCITAIVLLSILFLHRLVFAAPDRILAAFDMGHMQYFWAYFKKQCYLGGAVPLWCPNIFGGHPFAALPDTAAFYPPDILYLLLPLGSAMNLSIVIHQIMAGIFTYLFCREIRLGPNASVLGAIAFMLHGFFINQLVLGHVDIVRTAYYLPVVMYFVERGLARSDWRSCVCGGLALGLQILCGHPQMYFYAILFLGAYTVLRIALFANLRRDGKKAFAPLLFVSLVVGLGICLSLFQLLLTFEFSQLSDRASRSIDFAAYGSMHPVSMLQLFFPNLTISHHAPQFESSVYAGLIPLGAGIFAVLSCWKKNRHVPVLAVPAVLSLLVMLGERTPIFYIFYHIVPGMDFFRMHPRIVLVFAFCVSVLAAIGAEELFSGRARRESPKAFATVPGVFLTAILVLCGLLIFFPDSLSHTKFLGWNSLQTVEEAVGWGAGAVLLPLVWLVVAAGAIFLLGRAEASRRLQLTIIGVVWLELFTTFYGKLDTISVKELASPKPFMQKVKAAEGPFRVWFPTEPYASNRAIADRLENMNGYSPLMLERYMNFLSAVTGIEPAWKVKIMNHLTLGIFEELPPAVARLFNVRFAISVDPAQWSARFIENPNPVPRAYLVSSYRIAGGEEESRTIVSGAGFDPLATVILEEEPGIRPAPSDSEPQVLDVRTSVNEIEVSYQAAAPSIRVLSEQYYPGWKATIDGRPTKIYRADYLLRAVEAPQGAHTVRFSFRPAAMSVGLPISLIVLVGAIAALIAADRRKKTSAQT